MLRVLGLALLASPVVVAAVLYRPRRMPEAASGEEVAAERCRAGYRGARPAADTAMTDAQRPIASREQATAGRTCRELRLAGATR